MRPPRWASLLSACAAAVLVIVPAAAAAPGGAAGRGTAVSSRPLISRIDFKSAALGFALTEHDVRRTLDGGLLWRTIRVPGIDTIAGALFLDPSHWWVASASTGGQRVVIARTADGGRSWQRTMLSGRYPDGYGQIKISFADREHGWLTVNTVHSSAFADVDLYRTSDGGAAWVGEGHQPFLGPIAFTSLSRGWAIAGPGDDRLYASTDGGRSWRARTLPAPKAVAGQLRTLDLPVFTDPMHGVIESWFENERNQSAYQDTVVFEVTGDGGAHWSPLTPRLPKTPLRDPGFSKYGPGIPIPWAVIDKRHWLLGTANTLYETSDGGQRWYSPKPNRPLPGLQQLSFVSAGVGWARLQNGRCRQFKRDCFQSSTLLKTVDGGFGWGAQSIAQAHLPGACRTSQLTARAGLQGATGSQLGGVAVRNRGASACVLPVTPRVSIVWRGRALAIRRQRPPSVPAGAESFPQVPIRILAAGRRAYAVIQWFNWCGPRLWGRGYFRPQLQVRISQGEPPLDLPLGEVAPARCDAPKQPSVLDVGRFVQPP